MYLLSDSVTHLAYNQQVVRTGHVPCTLTVTVDFTKDV